MEAPLKRVEERAAEDLRRTEQYLLTAIQRLEQQVTAQTNTINFLEKQLVRDIERHNGAILNLQAHMDKVLASNSDLKTTVSRAVHDIEVLMDTAAAQGQQMANITNELRPLQSHMNKIDGVLKVGSAILAITGVVLAIYEAVFKK
jgi:chromosome segregation ATPase